MIPAILVLLGGVTVAVGTLFTWLDLTVAGISFSSGIFIKGAAHGTDLSYGIVALVAGGVLAVVGILSLAFRRARWLSAAAILVALISGALALYVLITIESRFAEYAAQVAETDDPVALRQRVEGFFTAGSLAVNPGMGLYIALAGSFVSLMGGVVRMVGRRRSRAPSSKDRDVEGEEKRRRTAFGFPTGPRADERALPPDPSHGG